MGDRKCPGGGLVHQRIPQGRLHLQAVPAWPRWPSWNQCFASNVLSFASNFTMIKLRSSDEPRGSGSWEKLEQTDLREGTHPENSVWRPVGKVIRKHFVIRYFANLILRRKIPCCLFIRKDSVRVPADLPAGDYVLSLRWDVSGGAQVPFPLNSMPSTDLMQF